MKIYNSSFFLMLVSLVFSIFICETVLLLLNFPVGLVSEKFVPFWLDQPGVGLQGQQTLLNIDDPENVIQAYEYDADHGMRLKSNIDVMVKAFAIPDKEIEAKLPPWRIVTNKLHYRVWSDRRIIDSMNTLLIMGGSSPFGWGVEFKDSFPALMAQAEDKDFKVMNLAIPGCTIYDALLLYRKYRSSIKQSRLLYFILDAGSNNLGLSSMSDSNARAYRRSVKGKIRLLASRFRLYWLVKTYLNQYGYLLEKSEKIRVPYNEYKKYLKELLSMAVEDNGKIILLNICNNDKALIQIMKTQASELPIRFFDVNQYFDTVIKSDLSERFPELTKYYTVLYGSKRLNEYPRWILEFHKNCHPNMLGHKLLAGELRSLLR